MLVCRWTAMLRAYRSCVPVDATCLPMLRAGPLDSSQALLLEPTESADDLAHIAMKPGICSILQTTGPLNFLNVLNFDARVVPV